MLPTPCFIVENCVIDNKATNLVLNIYYTTPNKNVSSWCFFIQKHQYDKIKQLVLTQMEGITKINKITTNIVTGKENILNCSNCLKDFKSTISVFRYTFP